MVQCSQYCHNFCRDSKNARPLQEGTEAVVLLKSEDDNEMDNTIREEEI